MHLIIESNPISNYFWDTTSIDPIESHFGPGRYFKKKEAKPVDFSDLNLEGILNATGIRRFFEYFSLYRELTVLH